MKVYGWLIGKSSETMNIKEETFQIREASNVLDEVKFSTFMKGNESDRIVDHICAKLCERYGMEYDPMLAETFEEA